MVKPIKKYFVCANSCNGFVNYFPSNLDGMDRVYILKGGPGTGKSTLMKKVGESFAAAGEQVEYIYCSSDSSSLDGVILRDRKIAIVDGTAPHVVEPKAPGAVEEYVNLGTAWNRNMLAEHKTEIMSVSAQISERYSEVYRLLAEAKAVHDRWEKIYLDNINFDTLNHISEDLNTEVLHDMAESDKKGKSVHRFFGALTPDGSVNYIENLTEDISVRYFIKGRPGTGKSSIMKKLAARANDCGIDAEVYHCSFDPDSLDMVILPSLDICIFDSTAPHEIFPSRNGDIILDVYDAAVKPGTDEDNADTLYEISKEYDAPIERAKKLLAEIHSLHNELEGYYIKAVDFSMIDGITKRLINNIR